MPIRKGGKVSKGMKKFPRISDYLELHHAAVYQLLIDSGMIGNLTPKRGVGRTFLIPDAKLIKEIRKLLDSTDDGPERASEILGSLIVKDYLPIAKDWLAKKDDIPNVMGKKVQVKGGNATKVELVAGTIELDKKYAPFTRQGRAPRGNTAVWKLKGHVPHDAKVPDATGKYIRKGTPIKGAFEFLANERLSLAQLTERIACDFEQGKNEAFEEALAGLLDLNKDDELCRAWVCMNLAHGPEAAYFLVFQPNCSPGMRVLDDQVKNFLNSDFKSTSPNPSRSLLKTWETIKRPHPEKLVAERFDKLDKIIESAHKAKDLESAYEQLASDNSLGEGDSIIPGIMHGGLHDKLKRMASDEGFALHKFLAANDEMGLRYYQHFKDALDRAQATRKALRKFSDANYKNPVFSDPKMMENFVKSGQLQLSQLVFLRSSHCLNIAMPPAAIKGMGEYDEAAESPFNGGDINHSVDVVGSLEHAAAARGSGMVDIPDGLLAAIKNYAEEAKLTLDSTLGDLGIRF